LLLASLTLSFCQLGPYNVDKSSVTVGGLSSGAYFAVQFQVAYSGSIRGAAVFAGGPYYCAQNSLVSAVLYCMSAMTPTPSVLVSAAEGFASQGNIDNLGNLKNQVVYIFSGTGDNTVKQGVVKTLVEFYKLVQLSNVTSDFGLAAGHGFPTVDYGVTCSASQSPYLMKCNFDGAAKSLSAMYGPLNPKTAAIASNLLTFDQSTFTKKAPSSISMGPKGFVYVPTSCKNNSTCKLHIAFHGCKQTIGDIGNVYYTKTGLNEQAEANNIIVLYPQVQTSSFSPTNPNGCWDWWGYNEAAYAWKSGSQMAAVKAMMDAVIGKQR